MSVSNMSCSLCCLDIDQCACPELDDNLKKIVFTKGNKVMVKWCAACDKHFARCKCKYPEFKLIAGGEEVDASKGFLTADGKRIFVDLSRR